MNQNVHSIYAPYIITEVIEGHQIQLLSPLHFLEGLKNLQILDFTELEIACVMNVLAKPQLDNAILVDELVQIMQNFGVMTFSHQQPMNMGPSVAYGNQPIAVIREDESENKTHDSTVMNTQQSMS